MKRSALAVVLLIGTAGVSSACGGSGQTTPTASGGSVSPTTQRARAASLPLSGAMRFSGDFATLTAQAGEKLVAQCMKRVGLTYRSHDLGNLASTMDELPFGPFGIESLKDLPAPTTSKAQQAQWTPTKEEQTPKYQQALNGTGKSTAQIEGPNGQSFPIPTDGCQFESMQALFGSKDAAIGFYRTSMGVAKAQQDAHSVADAKPEMIAALAKWRTCMRKLGYSFTKPTDVMGKMPAKQQLSTWKTAKDDVGCKTHSDLLGTGYRVLEQAEQEQVDKNPGLVTGLKDTMETVNDRAKQVLAGTLTL